MVVQGILALALALPTGLLFGVGYGTGVRIGYEQVYPLLFPKGAKTTDSEQLQTNMKAINTIYNTIGGKEASNMGIAQGLNNARTELENNPDFRWLEELASRLSGPTPSSSVNLSPTGGTSSSLPPVGFSESDANILNKPPSQQEIRKITDIPSLARLIDRLESMIPTSNTNYLIAVARAQIKKLRDSSTTLTIQQQNQQQLDNRIPANHPDFTGTRAATSQEQEFNIWRDKVFQVEKKMTALAKGLTTNRWRDWPETAKAERRKLVAFSNQYRTSNNLIRRYALRLRNQLNGGLYGA